MRDIRLALRMLLKNPGFAAVAALTLAIGVGATTIVFTIVNGIILKPLEYPHSDRIVNVWEGNFEEGFTYGYKAQTSPANFMDWRRENTVFESLALWANHSGAVTRSFSYLGKEEAHRLTGRFVSKDFFKVFGVKPFAGRTFHSEEEMPGGARVVVVSHRFWTQYFDNDPSIIGKSVILENVGRHSYEIIGVMPEGFRFQGSDVWVSIAHMPSFPLTHRGGTIMSVIGRLKEGITLERAKSQMNMIQWRIHDEFKGLELKGSMFKVSPNIDLEPLLDSVVSNVRSSLVLFGGAVGLLLLIAVANVGNLLLSRALTRQREMSIRAALGARRWQLIRQLLSESLVLSLIGGFSGVFLAWGGLQLLLKFNAGAIPRAGDIGVDLRVLGFTILVSLVTAVLFGFAPALQTSKPDLNDALRQGSNRLTGDKAHHYIRNAFTITQVTLAFALLIGASLLIQSFNRMQSIDMGFESDGLLTVEVTMTGAVYPTKGHRVAFLRQLIDEMKATPGVESASAISVLPHWKGWPYSYMRPDLPLPPPSERPKAALRSVTEDHYKTYNIEVLKGRSFNLGDKADSEPVVMVNKTFSETVFAEEEALGKHLSYYGKNWRIIGIYEDVKNNGITREAEPGVNMPLAQWPGPDSKSVYLTLRTRADPMSLAPIVTEKVLKLNSEQPLSQFVPMQSYLDNSTAVDRFRSLLLGLFALAALFLASIGIYGVVSYSVAQRTNEMGVRLALGAQPFNLLLMILRQGLRMTLVGIGFGIFISWAFGRILASQLYGIEPTDPVTYAVVSVALILVGAFACIVPAVRAMRVSPTKALRWE